jgi:2-hydroxycyclohexanecarboxyl-CoA dehydrogenase
MEGNALTSRVALVTGAASGMGQGIARDFAAQGHRVGLLDINEKGLAKVAAELTEQGAKVLELAVDVADRIAVNDAIRRTRSEFGGIEILVTAAGFSDNAPVTQVSPEMWKRIVDVDLHGVFYAIQASIGDMIDARWGRIATVASYAGDRGAASMVAYSTAKGGVIAMTKALSKELGPFGITVNTITPTAIDTPMLRSHMTDDQARQAGAQMPVGRLGTVGDFVGLCRYLCSEESGFVSGQVIGLSGGGG